jgi:uncharacterized membrane protein
MQHHDPTNPYAGPQTPFEPPAPASPTGSRGGTPLPWTVGEAVNWAFKALFSNGGRPAWQMALPMLAIFALVLPVYGAIGVSAFQAAAAAQAAGTTPVAPEPPVWLFTVVYPILFFVGIWIWLGLVRYSLQIGRGQVPKIGLLFKFESILPALGLWLLTLIGVYGGMLLLIVPGIILGIGWCLGLTFVVDQSLGPIDALKASWRMTSGSRWKLFGLSMLMMLISFGLQMVCVGFFWSYPLMVLTMTYAYLRMNGETATLPGAVAAPTHGIPAHQA